MYLFFSRSLAIVRSRAIPRALALPHSAVGSPRFRHSNANPPVTSQLPFPQTIIQLNYGPCLYSKPTHCIIATLPLNLFVLCRRIQKIIERELKSIKALLKQMNGSASKLDPTPEPTSEPDSTTEPEPVEGAKRICISCRHLRIM